MKLITPHYVRIVHEKVIALTGGALGVRDKGLLESACARPFATFGSFEAYPDLVDKAAALGAGIIQNHPFVDGNKRVGMIVAIAYLEAHRVRIDCSQEDIITMALKLAEGSADWSDFGQWLRQHRVVSPG